MLLKSLEIQGFKSFCDKTLFTFGDGITVVVGPNGSGKSNIADAMRWVMGEQSSKTLRGDRMEDVIFGGSAGRKPQGFAEVSLTIDNSSRRFEWDGDEITVTRRYYRSGESEFLLNKTSVRLRDIHELFMDTGLGRDGYSIIGQGRIAEIVAAKSEDRREIFEEAAGIAKFRYKKEDAERRLADAQENLLRLHDILSEIEQRLGPLREQSEKAKKFLELGGEKKTLEVGLWVLSLEKQRAALRDNDNKLDTVRAQYDGLEKSLADLDAQLEGVYLEAQKKTARADELRRSAQELEEQAVKKQSAADLLRNDISHHEENIAQLKSEAEDARRLGGETEEQIARRAEESDARGREAAALEEEIKNRRAAIDALAEKNEQFSGQLAEASRSLDAYSEQVSEATLRKKEAETSLAGVEERAGAIEGELSARAARRDEAEKALGEARSKRSECEESLASLKNSLGGYEIKLSSRGQKLAEAEKQERAVSLRLSERTQRAAMLTELEKHMEGFAGSVKLIVRESARGALRGIRGPVSRLLRVPEKYAVAIETALGGSLQHIVTDDEACAKEAIAFLKRCDGGRATFLPLTSIRGTVAEGSFKGQAGYIGVGSELVGCDAAFDGIVRHLLGRTIVAQDLDRAVEIARSTGYRYRVVTLDGQVVNAGGSMTGGSQSRGAGLLSRAGEIERLGREAEAIRAKLTEITAAKKAVMEETAALQAAVSGLRGEIATAQEEKIRLEGEEKRLSGIAETALREIEALGREKAALEKKREDARAASVRADEDLHKAEEAAGRLREELQKLGGGRQELLAERDRLASEETQLRLSLVEAKKDVEQILESIETLRQAQKDREAAAAGLDTRIASQEEQIAQARAGIEAAAAEAGSLREQAAGRKADCEQLARERQTLEQSTTGLRAREREIGDDKEKVSKELARLEERRASFQAEYDAVVARLWDEYELTRSQAEEYAASIAEPAKAQRRLNELKSQIKALGAVNVAAIDEYKEVSERYEFLSRQIADAEQARDELNSLIAGLTAKMRVIFSEQFEAINRHFGEVFAELFGGGSGSLRLTEPDDVLTSGIEINVQPPGKIIRNLQALSGGEQAFVAIALYFAILKVRPSPFCVLDEIEAALDDANIGRFAAYLQRMCDDTQFIVITHRRGTMDVADVLYGVTMQEEGVSKLLRLDVSQLAQKLGIA